jgi:hypothetical protein
MVGCPSCDVGNCDPCPLCGDYDPMGAQFGPRYFDRAGNPIGIGRFIDLTEHDVSYRIVRKTRVGNAEVSTVWLGLDFSMLSGPPLIFETMVFDIETAVVEEGPFAGMVYHPSDDFQQRYWTETAAVRGHWETVEALTLKAENDVDLGLLGEKLLLEQHTHPLGEHNIGTAIALREEQGGLGR